MTIESAGGTLEGLDWGHAGRPHPGEVDSGDRHVVLERADGVLVAVIDGLGHGTEARDAAALAAASLARHHEADPRALVELCHEELRTSRGVAMSLALLRPEAAELVWVGVGNVEGVLVRRDVLARRARESLVPQVGVVGMSLPRLRPSRTTLGPGDVIAVVTDGVARAALDQVHFFHAPTPTARRLVEQHALATDDALALVLRVERP